ncbi:MAG: GtrA family protein [Propionibacteriaceae bacterium]|nr:GtrA family protein [Propionibacteriaceae bacterium]
MIKRLFTRYRVSLEQLTKFSLVGASGMVVNMVVAFGAKKIAPLIWENAQVNEVWLPIPGTPYNIRWFMVFSMIAFLVANLSNYQLNRMWSFRSRHHAGWFKEYLPFFIVGLAAQGLGMVMELALMHPNSPIALSSSVFNNSTGLRTKWYWAHLIMVCVAVPISFLLNKFWTFRAIRHKPAELAEQEA